MSPRQLFLQRVTVAQLVELDADKVVYLKDTDTVLSAIQVTDT